jgi:hypothetical protein
VGAYGFEALSQDDASFGVYVRADAFYAAAAGETAVVEC